MRPIPNERLNSILNILSEPLNIPYRLIRKTKRLISSSLRFARSAAQAPNGILSLESSNDLLVSTYNSDGRQYQAVRVDRARVYTNRRDNIAIIHGKQLIPHVSLQHHRGNLLSDNENFVLTRQIRLNSSPIHFNDTVVSLLTGEPANYNYFHWFFDCLARLVIASSLTKTESLPLFYVPDDSHQFQRESLDHLGITADRRISSAQVPYLSANRIIATTPSNPHPEDFAPWILEFVRESFLPLATETDPRSLIYIGRNDSSNSRRLLNEEDLWHALSAIGFQKVELSSMTLKQQVTLFSSAKMIVSVHGASLTNLAFAKSGTYVFELFADSFQPHMYQRISELLDLRYHSLPCPTSDTNPQTANLTIDSDAIKKIIEIAQIAANSSDTN